jgi:acetolactate synthase I/II/III large subunit
MAVKGRGLSMTGAQWVVKALKNQGISTVFGYPGGAIMPVYDALYDGGLEHILCRHEQGAVIAAIGYARASGRTGVCIATSGPGATNLITGLADAMMDSIPLVAITGQVATSLIGTDAFQETDVLGLSLACTKHSFMVQSAEELPEVLAEAFRIAASGRPGPVLVDIPKDIQSGQADFKLVPQAIPSAAKWSHTDLEAARTMLQAATAPIAYIGGGVGMANAVEELRAFLHETGIPSVCTLKGLGAVTAQDPLHLGMIGMHGHKAANLAVQECDLLIAIGARFDDRVTGQLQSFAPNAAVIHLDIDPAEFNKLRRAQVTLQQPLPQILPALAQPLRLKDWQARVQQLRQAHAASYQSPNTGIYSPTLLKTLADKMPTNTIVTTDVGQHQMWAAQHMQFSDPKNFVTSSGLGTMGFGLPAAVGAQVACPNSTVICVTGDGSIMMNIQELGTIKRKQLPVKILLLDNQRLGMVRQWQQLFFAERYSETVLTDNPDFLKIARAFSIPGEQICEQAEITDALDRLLNSDGTYFLHVSINEQQNVWPLVPPGSGNHQMMEEKV